MHLNNSIYKIVSIFCFSLLLNSANASIAYTIDGYNDLTGVQTLYSINTATGSVTAIGNTGYRISDIAWDRTKGKLYGAVKSRRFGDGYDGLVTINTSTGAVTEIGSWKDSSGNLSNHLVTQIDIDSTGKMYGSNKGGKLIEINSSTSVVSSAYHTVTATDGTTANVGLGRWGLSFDNSDMLWRNIGQTNQYVTSDIASNITTAISAIPNSNGFGYTFSGGVDLEKIILELEFNGLPFQFEVEGRHGSFDLSTGLFWVLNGETIFKYDMATGSIVDFLALTNVSVVENPFSVNQGIRGLAFAPVPVPATIWLFGSAIFGLARYSRNRSQILA